MNRILGITLLCVSMLFAGCSTMSKKDCINTDWYGVGLQDGRAGKPANRMSVYVSACEKHDITIGDTEYLVGHNEGITIYCQPDNGYQIGLKGRGLPNVCPAGLQAAFSDAHEKGYKKFKISRDISDSKHAISRVGGSIISLEALLIDATAELYVAATSESKAEAQRKVDDINNQIASETQKKVNSVGKLACASANWYTAGIADAKDGRAASTYSAHQRQCLDYHPASNQSHYKTGHAEGLIQYCAYDNGYTLGSHGRAMAPLCSGSGKRDFETGYRQGLQEHNEKLTIASLKIKTTQLDKLIPNLKDQKSKAEAEQKNKNLTSAQKLAAAKRLNSITHQLNDSEYALTIAMNELNCYVADWQALGFEEAEQGKVFSNTSRNCSDFGVAVDERQFEIGYDLGIKNYCTKENGSAVGRVGHEYLDVCPRSLEVNFLKGYQPAFYEYQRKQLRKQLSKDVEVVTNQLANVQSEIDLLTGDLDQTGLTRSERLNLINEIAALNKREAILLIDSDKVNSHYECLTDNWFELGKQHGNQGMPSQLKSLNCSRFALDTKPVDYRNGLARGLVQWCTFDRGYQLALNGVERNGTCSRTAHREFYRGYDTGLVEQQKQEDITALKLEKLELIELIEALKGKLLRVDEKLLNPNLSTRERRLLTTERLSYEGKVINTEIRMEDIEAELAALGG